MQQLNELKDKGQHGVAQALDAGKKQAGKAKTLGVTVGSAVVGGIALAAAAQPIIMLTSMLATPPVAMTVGAVAGGALGWRFVRGKANNKPSDLPAAQAPTAPTAPTEAPAPTAA